MASTTAKRTTVADLVAAAKVGAIDLTAEVVTAAESAKRVRSAEEAATSTAAPAATVGTVGTVGTEHDCAIPGCRHGAAHGPTQPDRQVKLECPTCGAIVRMTARAIGRCGGNPPICGGDGATFARSERRVYSRKAA